MIEFLMTAAFAALLIAFSLSIGLMIAMACYCAWLAVSGDMAKRRRA